MNKRQERVLADLRDLREQERKLDAAERRRKLILKGRELSITTEAMAEATGLKVGSVRQIIKRANGAGKGEPR